MTKCLIGAICAALIFTTPQTAEAFKNGRELLDAAKHEDGVMRVWFLAYVAGVADSTREIAEALKLSRPDIARPFCLGSKHTYGDIADTVRVWLRHQPNIQQRSASALIVLALAQHFPCKTAGEAK